SVLLTHPTPTSTLFPYTTLFRSTILMTMGMATTRLGLGATYSTTYYEPFHVARLFATMDLMLKGRAAWNIVTSLNSAEAGNFGRSEEHTSELQSRGHLVCRLLLE